MGPQDRKWLEQRLDWITQGLITLHLVLALIYLDDAVYWMLGVNLVCALVGCIALWLLRKGRFRAHTWTLYGTELTQLIVSALCVGWSAGFQIPLAGLTALVFLTEYLSRSLGLPFVPALPLGIASIVVYVAGFLVCFHKPGLLEVPQSTATTVGILWSVPVFGFLVYGLHAVLRLTSDSERALSDQAQTDELTGLLNRAGYDRLCARLPLETTTLLLVDTDKFKGINDTCGHETGDRVLKKIARELKSNSRRIDYVCRIGGDEFAILMVDTEMVPDASLTAKVARINRELSHTADDRLPFVSVSVGAAHGSDAPDWTALFKHADAALYEVKEAGGHGCQCYRPQR